MKNNILKILSIITTALVLYGCSNDCIEDQKDNQRGFSISADIVSFEDLSTRVNRDNEGDLWTIKSFNHGDIVGFYSLYGNSDAPGGNGSFENIQMTYGNTQSNGRTSFFNNEINFNTDNFVPNTAFFYYPYVGNIDYDSSHTADIGDGYGFELRDYSSEDKIERCNDLLWIYAPSTITGSVSFNHAFSSIVILRGEGFNNPKNYDVKVVLDKGFSHAVIEDEGKNYLKYFRLIYLDNYKKTEKECREWKAWRGKGSYEIMDKTPGDYQGSIFTEDLVHYVILPTHRVLTKPVVDYIEIEDNYGKVHKVSNFILYNNTKQLEHSQRYQLVIKLQDLEASVTTIGIDDWGEENEIQEYRAPGIGNSDELFKWMSIYGQYVKNRSLSNLEDELKNFGDMTEIESSHEVRWKFYINNDIDISGIVREKNKYFLEELDDIIEGGNFTFSGLNLTNEEAPSFIGRIGLKGKVQNLNFEKINLNCTSSLNSEPEPIGGITNYCEGEIENCTIDGFIKTNGDVGMIAGKAASTAIITKCAASGLIIGKSTSDGLVGRKDENSNVSENNNAGIIFNQIN